MEELEQSQQDKWEKPGLLTCEEEEDKHVKALEKD